MKTSRNLLIGLGALLVLALAVGLAFASDAAPAQEPESSPFFEATLQQAVDELDGKATASGLREPADGPQPTQHYTFDPHLWPECGPSGYTWDLLLFPWCHFTSDPEQPACDEPWPTQDYTWDSAIWPECDPTGEGITQDPVAFWCDPAWTADPQTGPQCIPGYTQDPNAPPWCNPRYTSDPALWDTCRPDVPYTADSQTWPECGWQLTSDPYLWPECHYTSDVLNPDCNVPPPNYPTQDYTSNALHWIECGPAFTEDPTLPQCEDPLYTLDAQLWPECNPLYTTSPVTWPVCHYTTDPASIGCEEPWPTLDFTWDPQLWPQCAPRTTYDPNWWCEPFWTADPDLWPGCNPVFTRSPDMVQCFPGYTYDLDVWPECGKGPYTYDAGTWPECGYYTADARIWPECHYTSDPQTWPQCIELPPYPTKDYTTDPRIWPECDVGAPPNYTTDPQAFPECHYTYDAPMWPECEPPPEELGDLGDAPDSTNHAGSAMTAYPAGGPPGVIAHYPTVFDPLTGLPKGPLHQRPRADSWLGPWVTLERDADLLPDEDGVTNILPASDAPDTDQFDDGVKIPLAVPHCVPTVFTYTVTISPGATMMNRYVNVWFDWIRDGDWEDVVECPDGTVAPEWAVQNQILPSLPPGTYVFSTPAFLPWSPPGADIQDIWMRISLAEQPAPNPEDGRGPDSGYQYGETEDYYSKPECPVPVADFTWDPPTICPTTTVQFWDTSTNAPTSWSWDFGDGLGSSTAQNPSYTYSTAGVGTYNVSLTVSNICGSDTITKTLVVTDCTPPDQYYDIYMKDSSSDDGSVPSSSPWWSSPDIWVRNDGDCTQTVHQNPINGTTTTVCVRVRNRMTTTVDNITVNVYYASGALAFSWPGTWSFVGSLNIPTLAGGAMAVQSVSWHVPYLTGHFCFLARADAPHDPISTGPDTVVPVDRVNNNNNIAQRNVNVVAYPEITGCGVYTTTIYTDVVYFDVVNTLNTAATVDIVFDSGDFPLGSGTLTAEPGSLLGRWTSLSGFNQSGNRLLVTAFPATIGGVSLTPFETARMTMTIAAEIDYDFTVDIDEKTGGTELGGIQYVRELPRCLYLPTIVKAWTP